MRGGSQRFSMPLPPSRRLAFSLAALCLAGALVFLADRAIAWRLDFGNPLALLTDAGGGPRARCFSLAVNRAGAPSRAPRRKPSGTIRVFTFGGSATYGVPFAFGGSFSRWFAELAERRLADRVEILNTGAPAQPVNDVVRKAEASLAYEPDIWIVYSGNNEFLASNNEVIRPRDKQPRRRIAADFLRRRSPLFAWLDERLAPYRGPGPGDAPLRLRDVLPAARDNYRNRLTQLADLARQRGVTLVLCTVPANYADWEPLSSVPGNSAPAPFLRQWDADVDPLRRALRQGDCPGAARILDAYRGDFVGHAQFAFLSGKYEQVCGSPARAYALYHEAAENDFDAVRARPTFNDDVRQIAREHGALLLDLVDLFERQDPNRFVGFNLFVDSCHPTIRGQYLAGATMFEALVRHGALHVNNSWTGAAPSFDAVLAEHPAINWSGYVNSACLLLTMNAAYAEQAEKWALTAMTGGPFSGAWATVALARAARGDDPKPPLRQALALADGSAAKVLAAVPVPREMTDRLAGWLAEIATEGR